MAKRWRLLVVDQDPGIYRYLRRHLSRAGYQVASAQADEAGLKSAAWRPELVLLDTTLNQSDLLIRTLKAATSAPIVALLPREDAQNAAEALNGGADDCIAKPFGLEELS